MPDPFASLARGKQPESTPKPAAQPTPEGTLASEFDEELAKTRAFFKEADAKRDAAIDFNGDGEFFTCVVFPTKAHRDVFLEAVKAISYWDNDPQYIDGMELCKYLKIELPHVPQLPTPRVGHGWRGVPLIL